MNLQRVCVKVFAEPAAGFDDAALIQVYHDWIRRGAAPGTLIDVADYRHVPDGPGVMLIAHEGDYALDRSGGRPGLQYQRKTNLPGDLTVRLAEIARHALTACRLLQSDPRIGARLAFVPGELRVIANDRLLAPNTDKTYRAIEPHLQGLGQALYGAGTFTLQRLANDPRERLAACLTSAAAADVNTLLGRLARPAT